MSASKKHNRKKIFIIFVLVVLVLFFLLGRLVYLMVFCSEYYGEKAENLHERERDIKAARGEIIDATGTVLATNKTVCNISVIHSQVKDEEKVIQMLCKELDMPEDKIRKRVEKVSSIEKIKSNVEKEVGDRIRAHDLPGVKVDEDYKRFYPYDSLASKVLGFTGGDNQGIIGLEVKYDEFLKGRKGKILTLTDARGIEIKNAGESRLDPTNGYDLHVSLDYNIQMYAQQAAMKVMEEKSAENVCVVIMNPKNGEIMAMVQVPEFNLNDPFTLVENEKIQEKKDDKKSDKKPNVKKQQNKLNQMWRNGCLNDTYEPGSIFKIITTAAAFEEGVVKETDNFYCPGYKVVEDRRIRCSQVRGHGAQTFVDGIKNSCNPVFIELGMRLGVDNFYKYFQEFKLLEKTGVDLPGEAKTIMHAKKNMGLVELATVAFGQSFQITPIQLVTTVSSLINGGTRITPHLGISVSDEEGKTVETFEYAKEDGVVSKETSAEVCKLLEKVVSEGTGRNAAIEGYSIGGKTATSQTLPRSNNRYISSFLGFYPAEDPQVLALVTITNPKGIYYGGTVAAPVVRDIFENILPYLRVAHK